MQTSNAANICGRSDQNVYVKGSRLTVNYFVSLINVTAVSDAASTGQQHSYAASMSMWRCPGIPASRHVLDKAV